jgi:hypothetical protein
MHALYEVDSTSVLGQLLFVGLPSRQLTNREHVFRRTFAATSLDDVAVYPGGFGIWLLIVSLHQTNVSLLVAVVGVV